MRYLKLALFLFSFSFAACSGASLIDDINSNQNAETGTLNVMAVHHNHEGTAIAPNVNGEKEFDTDLGFHVTLQEAVVNWKHLQLISSGDDPECTGGLDQEITLDNSEDILLEDLVAKTLATATVPLTGYCGYGITVGPSEAHAVKFHEGEDHGSGLPVTFHLRGTWAKDLDSGSFDLQGLEPFTVTANFEAEEDGQSILHPLHFHGEGTETSVTFGNHYDSWLDGIDFTVDAAEEQLVKTAENIQAGVHRYTDHH